MSDRTWGQVVVVACPPQHVAAVADVIDQYGLANQDGPVGFAHPTPKPTVLVLGAQYTDDQMTCGAAEEIHGVLHDLDGVGYLVSEDPEYDWLGTVCFRLPDGRKLVRTADNDQNVLLDESAWRIIRDKSKDEVYRMLVDHFRIDIVDEFQRLRDEITALPEAERTLQVPDEEQE